VVQVDAECGEAYFGQTSHSIKTRVNEHHQYVELYQLEKLIMLKHNVDFGHGFPLNNTSVLTRKSDTFIDS
jgi:hypothetical protein